MLTVLGKEKGAKNCTLKGNELKKQLSRVLSSMVVRCYCESHSQYKNYGGRGIKICNEWISDKGLDNFYEWSIKNGFTGEKRSNGYNAQEIDRIDVNKNYSPENCRWITHKQQSRNKRTNKNFTYLNKTQCLKAWAEELDLSYMALYLRIFRRHWSFEKAISIPIKER